MRLIFDGRRTPALVRKCGCGRVSLGKNLVVQNQLDYTQSPAHARRQQSRSFTALRLRDAPAPAGSGLGLVGLESVSFDSVALRAGGAKEKLDDCPQKLSHKWVGFRDLLRQWRGQTQGPSSLRRADDGARPLNGSQDDEYWLWSAFSQFGLFVRQLQLLSASEIRVSKHSRMVPKARSYCHLDL